MRDALIIFLLCMSAIIIGGWLFFYAPPSIAAFPYKTYEPVTYQPPRSHVVAVEVAFSQLISGTQANVAEQKHYTVRAADAFAELWDEVIQTPSTPDVDFAKNDVIAVFAGQKLTGGYDITVEKVTDTKDARIVSIVLTEPGKGCVVTEALTSPFEIVQVPASALTPVRDERTEVKDCE